MQIPDNPTLPFLSFFSCVYTHDNKYILSDEYGFVWAGRSICQHTFSHIVLGCQYFTYVDDCAHSVAENVECHGTITMCEYKGEGNVYFYYGSVKCYVVTKYWCRLMIRNNPVLFRVRPNCKL